MIVEDAINKRSRGFGFITFTDSHIVDGLVSLHHVTVKNKVIECKYAEPRKSSRRECGTVAHLQQQQQQIIADGSSSSQQCITGVNADINSSSTTASAAAMLDTVTGNKSLLNMFAPPFVTNNNSGTQQLQQKCQQPQINTLQQLLQLHLLQNQQKHHQQQQRQQPQQQLQVQQPSLGQQQQPYLPMLPPAAAAGFLPQPWSPAAALPFQQQHPQHTTSGPSAVADDAGTGSFCQPILNSASTPAGKYMTAPNLLGSATAQPQAYFPAAQYPMACPYSLYAAAPHMYAAAAAAATGIPANALSAAAMFGQPSAAAMAAYYGQQHPHMPLLTGVSGNGNSMDPSFMHPAMYMSPATAMNLTGSTGGMQQLVKSSNEQMLPLLTAQQYQQPVATSEAMTSGGVSDVTAVTTSSAVAAGNTSPFAAGNASNGTGNDGESTCASTNTDSGTSSSNNKTSGGKVITTPASTIPSSSKQKSACGKYVTSLVTSSANTNNSETIMDYKLNKSKDMSVSSSSDELMRPIKCLVDDGHQQLSDDSHVAAVMSPNTSAGGVYQQCSGIGLPYLPYDSAGCPTAAHPTPAAAITANTSPTINSGGGGVVAPTYHSHTSTYHDTSLYASPANGFAGYLDYYMMGNTSGAGRVDEEYEVNGGGRGGGVGAAAMEDDGHLELDTLMHHMNINMNTLNQLP